MSTTHNILWNVDGQKWFDEGHAVAIYEAIHKATDLQHCRDVGRDAARYAMVSTWHDMMQPLLGLIGGTPRLAFEQLDAKFHELYDQRPAKLLFIKSAPNRKYGDIVRAMDVARGAGVQVIGFTPAEQAAAH